MYRVVERRLTPEQRELIRREIDTRARRAAGVRLLDHERVAVVLPPGIEHGERRAHRRFGCRCVVCVKAESARRCGRKHRDLEQAA